VARLLFFIAPIIIPIERFPERFHTVLEWNPFSVLVAQTRVWVIDPDAPSWGDVMGGWDHLVYPIALLVTLCILAVWAVRGLISGVAERV
jgi:ABC-type polysaccharide/polyol phosphate export permease